jgi:endonuclease III
MTAGRGIHSPGEVVRALRRSYPAEPQGAADPFCTLVATVLSQRTREEKTAEAARNLFAVFPDAASLAAASPGKVVALIRPAGFYNQKAPTIIELSRRLVSDFGGRVPCDIESLLSLPGVGRKTANCVLVYGFGISAIPVDTHVHRISNRLGWVRTRKPEETEAALVRCLPKRYWLDINELFVLFGRELCRPVGPLCQECALTRCPSRGKVKAGSRKGRAYAPGFKSSLLGGLGKALNGMTRPSGRGGSASESVGKPRISVRGARRR